jgi:hypothetical protein
MVVQPTNNGKGAHEEEDAAARVCGRRAATLSWLPKQTSTTTRAHVLQYATECDDASSNAGLLSVW